MSILQQDEMHDVTELEVFQACKRWAEKKKNPRGALGNALGLIRFCALTAEEFADHVCSTGLLTGQEQSLIFKWLATRKGDMPQGFNSDVNPRYISVTEPNKEDEESYNLVWPSSIKCSKCKKINIVKWDHVQFAFGYNKWFSLDEIFASSPLRILLKTDWYILGVLMHATRQNENKDDVYKENFMLKIRRADGTTSASVAFSGNVTAGRLHSVLFDRPHLLYANEVYSLHVNFTHSNNKYLYEETKAQSYKTNSGLEFKVLETVMNPIHFIQFAAKC
jgi:hypothetical protein